MPTGAFCRDPTKTKELTGSPNANIGKSISNKFSQRTGKYILPSLDVLVMIIVYYAIVLGDYVIVTLHLIDSCIADHRVVLAM